MVIKLTRSIKAMARTHFRVENLQESISAVLYYFQMMCIIIVKMYMYVHKYRLYTTVKSLCLSTLLQQESRGTRSSSKFVFPIFDEMT